MYSTLILLVSAVREVACLSWSAHACPEGYVTKWLESKRNLVTIFMKMDSISLDFILTTLDVLYFGYNLKCGLKS